MLALALPLLSNSTPLQPSHHRMCNKIIRYWEELYIPCSKPMTDCIPWFRASIFDWSFHSLYYIYPVSPMTTMFCIAIAYQVWFSVGGRRENIAYGFSTSRCVCRLLCRISPYVHHCIMIHKINFVTVWQQFSVCDWLIHNAITTVSATDRVKLACNCNHGFIINIAVPTLLNVHVSRDAICKYLKVSWSFWAGSTIHMFFT